MNAPCPPNPCVAQTPGITISVRTFTASGTYMPSPGLVTAMVETIGGGGGGGGATFGAVGNLIVGGGGGGSGGYSRKALAAALVAGGVVVTVGAGGTADPAGAAVAGNGGDTTFGALVVGKGGLGGSGNPGGAAPYGALGDGAPVGTGDLTFPGTCGQSGVTLTTPSAPAGVAYTYPSAQGGVSWAGGAQNYLTADQSSHPGADALANTGSGGGGAIQNQIGDGPAQPGGAGGSGICWVTEFCWVGGSGGSGSGMVNVPACPPGQQWGWRGGWDG